MLVPRALDWVAIAPEVAERPTARWGMRFADHACLFMKLPLHFASRRRPPDRWRAADAEAPYAAWQQLTAVSAWRH